MKKITLVLFTFLAFQWGNAQLSENFESGTFPPTGWTSFIGANGLGTVENWKVQLFDTNTAVCVWEVLPAGQRSEDWLVTPQFTVLDTAPILFFDNVDSGTTDYGSIYTVRVSTASQTTHADFTVVDTQDETQIFHSQVSMANSTHSVDLSAYIGESIYVAFVLEQNDGDLWRIDNVLMGSDVDAPNPVTTPTPADLAVDVYIDPTDDEMLVAFDWEPAVTGDAATAYDVYLGNSALDLVLLGTTPNDFVNITGMEYSTTYFWQIVAKNVGGEAVGSSVWSFTTEADPSLSVDEFENKAFDHFYNKDSDILTLTSSTLAFDNVELYNLLGQQVLNRHLSQTNETVNMSSLEDGVYLAKVSIQGRTQTVKILKN